MTRQTTQLKPGAARRLVLQSGAAIAVAALLANGLYSRHAAHAALVRAALQDAAVQVATARPQAGPATEALVLPGEVRGMLEAPVYARTSGYLRSWTSDIGAHVTAGQVLAVIDSPELDQQLHQAEAELLTAKANAQDARGTAARAARLVLTQSVSRQEAEDRAAAAAATAAAVASAQANVARLRELQGFERVTAPFSGVITARDTDVGNLISAGTASGPELFRIADLSRLRTYVDVPQSYAASIHVGTPADLEFPERPGVKYRATVTRTASAIDPQARTLRTELDIDNRNGELLPGSFTEAHFNLAHPGARLRLRANMLLFRAEGLRIAVVGPDHRVTLKPVILGRDFGTVVEVLGGVAPTDDVIINPPAAIETGDVVSVVAGAAAQQARS